MLALEELGLPWTEPITCCGDDLRQTCRVWVAGWAFG